METGPFYSMFDVGDYTFAPWKVVWPEVGHELEAAVAPLVSDKPVVPDHTLIMIDCGCEEEAHFVCGLLNSTLVRIIVRGYIVLHPDPHVLDHIRIFKYDPESSVHKALAKSSHEAHEAAVQGDVARLREIEERIDQLAAQLWGLTDKELAEIWRNKEENRV
ncbi:MAG: hypothetical protein H5T41_10985 [Methanomassiliicoccales archaeon]|nr:hypothetical protein [Methanomassiliicoccales archaeon]